MAEGRCQSQHYTIGLFLDQNTPAQSPRAKYGNVKMWLREVKDKNNMAWEKETVEDAVKVYPT